MLSIGDVVKCLWYAEWVANPTTLYEDMLYTLSPAEVHEVMERWSTYIAEVQGVLSTTNGAATPAQVRWLLWKTIQVHEPDAEEQDVADFYANAEDLRMPWLRLLVAWDFWTQALTPDEEDELDDTRQFIDEAFEGGDNEV